MVGVRRVIERGCGARSEDCGGQKREGHVGCGQGEGTGLRRGRKGFKLRGAKDAEDGMAGAEVNDGGA